MFGQSLQTIRRTNLHHLSLCFDCSSTIGHFPPPFWLLSYSGKIYQKLAQYRLYSWNKLDGNCKFILALFMNLCTCISRCVWRLQSQISLGFQRPKHDITLNHICMAFGSCRSTLAEELSFIAFD